MTDMPAKLHFLCFFLTAWSVLGGEEDKTAQQRSTEAPRVLFALKQVHRENEPLLAAIHRGKTPPAGYEQIPLRITNGAGQQVDQTPLPISRKSIITQNHIQRVVPTDQDGVAYVKLNREGAKLLNAATKKMELGRDRIAIVFRDQCLLAPVIQAVLSDAFLIEGLKEKAELDRVIKALPPKETN